MLTDARLEELKKLYTPEMQAAAQMAVLPVADEEVLSPNRQSAEEKPELVQKRPARDY